MLADTFPHVLVIELDIFRGLGAEVTGLHIGLDLETVGRDLGQKLGTKIGGYEKTTACKCGAGEDEEESGEENDIHYPIRGNCWFFFCLGIGGKAGLSFCPGFTGTCLVTGRWWIYNLTRLGAALQVEANLVTIVI